MPKDVVTSSLSLVEDLTYRLGRDQVITDADSLARTSHDTWAVSTKWDRLARHPYSADVIVRVRTATDVAQVLDVARRHGVPVTVRAMGSSVTGQPLPVDRGIVLEVGALAGARTIDVVDMTVTVPAGYPGGQLEDELNAEGWTLGHSPQSLYRSSVGGWVATLATGQFSSFYGGIEDLICGYEVVLATGEKVSLKASPRAAMGPDLRRVFVGSEGTLGVITAVTLKIFPIPETRLFDTVTFPSVVAGLGFMRKQVSLGMRPFLLRLYDVEEARHAMQDTSFDSVVVFLGTQGPVDTAKFELTQLRALATDFGGITLGPAGAQAWMGRRFDFSMIETRLATSGGFAETIEVAHTWRGIEALHKDLTAAMAPLADEVLTHFSHVYTQGTSMYVILLGQVSDDTAALAQLEQIWSTAMKVCLAHGAELSHHHGGGLARSAYAQQSLGSAHLVLRRIKTALDPDGTLNPGKLGL